jgi:Sigma-70, region 4
MTVRNPVTGLPERDITNAETDEKAARLRAQGCTYPQIAQVMGCTVSTAWKRVQRAIAAVPVEAVGELRAIECQRLDAVIARLWGVVHADHPLVSHGRRWDDLQDAGPVLQALHGIVRASESKRKLLGLDAPSRSVVEVITEDVVDAELRRLESEMAALDESAGS